QHDVETSIGELLCTLHIATWPGLPRDHDHDTPGARLGHELLLRERGVLCMNLNSDRRQHGGQDSSFHGITSSRSGFGLVRNATPMSIRRAVEVSPNWSRSKPRGIYRPHPCL